MKSLYQVEVTVLVWATDEEEALALAYQEAREEDGEVYEARTVPQEWWDAIPYGGEGDLTCGQLLRRTQEA